jgi:hypothetical protein
MKLALARKSLEKQASKQVLWECWFRVESIACARPHFEKRVASSSNPLLIKYHFLSAMVDSICEPAIPG